MIRTFLPNFRRLWSPCWLGHEKRVLERDARGRLCLVCPRCRHARVIDLKLKKGNAAAS